MKHKKFLRKQVEGDREDSENVSDDKEDNKASMNLKYIKKEDIRFTWFTTQASNQDKPDTL